MTAALRSPSYYTASLNDATQYTTLQGQVSVDVVIIGGGFTGVASAVELAERGLKVAIVETHRIGWGASGRNGGQVTGSLSGDEAMREQMRKRLGDEVDDFIWHLRWRGHAIIEQRVKKYAIDCDLKHGHLHAAMKPSHMAELRAFSRRSTTARHGRSGQPARSGRCASAPGQPVVPGRP